jgi:hypothetical protein
MAADGGKADGRGAAAPVGEVGGVAAVAEPGGTAPAAPATATPARNLRRSTIGCVSSRAIFDPLVETFRGDAANSTAPPR